MKTQRTRWIVIALCMMLVMALASCTAATPTAPAATASSEPAGTTSPTDSAEATVAPLDPVELTWYSPTGLYADLDLVTDKLNEYLKDSLNVTLKPYFLEWTDFGTKVPVMLTSGQNMDIVFTMAWSGNPYVACATSGYYAPLDDLITQYAPKTKALFSDQIWDGVRIKGSIYVVPSYKDLATQYQIMYNGKLAKELGVDFEQPFKSFLDVVPVLYKAKELKHQKFPEDDNYVVGYNTGFEYCYLYESIISGVGVNIDGINSIADQGSGEKVFSVYETPEYASYCALMRQLVVDGISPMDPQYDSDQTKWQSGKMLTNGCPTGYIFMDPNSYGENVEAKVANLGKASMTTAYVQCGNAISVTSQNKERAMMLLEQVNTDETLATMIRLGIEGTHYEVESDGRLNCTIGNNADVTNRGYFIFIGWMLGNITASKIPNTHPADIWDRYKDLNNNSVISTNLGFTFDASPVQNEIAAISSVISEYQAPLSSGLVDVDKTLGEFKQKLKDNGIDKIVQEVQNQLNTWRAGKGLSTVS